MLAILRLLMTFAADLFRSRRHLEVENLSLRHQLNIVLRRAPRRLRLHGSDRAVRPAILTGSRDPLTNVPRGRGAERLPPRRQFSPSSAIICAPMLGDSLPQSIGFSVHTPVSSR